MTSKAIRVAAEGEIAAPPGRVYAILADYREGRPSMMPPAIPNPRAIAGGVGDGAVATATVALAGRAASTTLRITEPEPGRALRETADENGALTGFVVDPAPGGCRVRIEISRPAAPCLGAGRTPACPAAAGARPPRGTRPPRSRGDGDVRRVAVRCGMRFTTPSAQPTRHPESVERWHRRGFCIARQLTRGASPVVSRFSSHVSRLTTPARRTN